MGIPANLAKEAACAQAGRNGPPQQNSWRRRVLRMVNFLAAVDPDCYRSTRFVGGALMKYMLLIYSDEQSLDDPRRQHCYEESLRLVQELNSSGHYLAAAPLHPTSTA